MPSHRSTRRAHCFESNNASSAKSELAETTVWSLYYPAHKQHCLVLYAPVIPYPCSETGSTWVKQEVTAHAYFSFTQTTKYLILQNLPNTFKYSTLFFIVEVKWCVVDVNKTFFKNVTFLQPNRQTDNHSVLENVILWTRPQGIIMAQFHPKIIVSI